MNREDNRISDYVGQVARHLAGTPQSREQACEELTAHLNEAAQAGELESALARLGDTRKAARDFNLEKQLSLATMGQRLKAAFIDNIPLVAVTIGLAVQPTIEGVRQITLAFPPLVYLEFSLPFLSGCVALVPVTCGVYPDGWIYSIGLPLALIWSIIGLGVIESRTGTTPGKYLLGLRVTDDDGLLITPRTGIVRRLTFLGGPLAWLDWLPVLKGDQRRIFDHIANTQVINIRTGGVQHNA